MQYQHYVIPSPWRLLAAALCCSGSSLSAQQAETAPASDAEPDVVVLSVFEVRTTLDAGYRVENAVATTGVAQALLDTPLPITVVTDEFLKDAGLEGFTGALRYVSSVSLDPHSANGNFSPGFGRGNSQGNGTTFRGQPYNGTYRNGLRQVFGFSTENVDRIEVAKGPMAVFVGGATLGGEVNVVTKKPQFSSRQEMYFEVGSHHSYQASLDVTGPITSTLAYRLIADYQDGNTWREHSDYRKLFVNPQVLWQPSERFTTRLDGYIRDASGNLVSQNISDTGNYQAIYDSPPQDFLDLGRNRSAGALPYTVEEYRRRIGQSFGAWRQDVFDATGRWVSLGDSGNDLIDGPVGRAYNWYGPNADYDEPVRLLESDTTLSVTDWLHFHATGRSMNVDLEHAFYSFGQRPYPDGNYPLDFGSGTRVNQTALDGKLEGVVKGDLGPLEGSLLAGYQYNRTRSLTEDAFMDFSSAVAVPASPNVNNNPAPTLTGQLVYHWFDPRVHDFPDTRLVTRWPSEVRGDGQLAYNVSRETHRAAYTAASVSAFEKRVTLTGGFRRSSSSLYTEQQDPDRDPLASSVNRSETPTTSSYMYGVSVRTWQGLNAYASYNKGNTARTGSLINRLSFGISPPDIVTPAEQAANPSPNDIGEGKEIGLKFDLFEKKLTGSIGWFQMTHGNVLVTDTARNGDDPRNQGTEVDNNPATADPSVRQRVNWLTPIDGNITEGFEVDLIWTPTRSYSLLLGASHLTENEITVSPPLGTDPTSTRNFQILNGRPLDLAPDDTFRLYQRYEFLEGTLQGASVGLGVRYQSEFMPQGSSANWGILFPDFTVVDLSLGYATEIGDRKVDFALNITNLLDSVYIEGQRHFGSPREFTFSTRVRF